MAENVIITKKARENMVKARAGALALPKITGMAFGNGGVDAGGNVITPQEDQAELANELYRKEINGFEFIDDTTCRYTCTLTEPELAGEDISEIGLYDENGDIACIKNFKSKGKDSDMEMTFTLDDVF
ncbi:MAG: phage tail protein [Lachnospiraceae bacterium]